MVTSCPLSSRSPATVSPDGPEPMTATFFSGFFSHSRDVSGPVFPFIVGGKTLQITDGHGAVLFAYNAFALTLFLLGTDPAADRWKGVSFPEFGSGAGKSPSAMHLMNSGMSTDTGHPSTQDGFLHCKHRLASVIAISSVSPSGTSSKFLRLTSGSCSGILTRSIFSFFAIYSSVQLTGCMFMRCFFQRFPCWFFLRPDRTPVVWPARQNPLCVRQIPDRPHRRTWYLRPRIRGSTRTCRFRRP